ncbi:hypothetical protein SAMN02745171_01126 [Porphyromonas circumdentaria]|uniref:Uncharacterized protein n=1 Tax=Porphyromonas circumdentaria TaxID=29524 RepID=A0A1T4NI39_9PORP|nr:hypothetical protein SAMN02745171_01126 [Porphyromonas circumdentaria]
MEYKKQIEKGGESLYNIEKLLFEENMYFPVVSATQIERISPEGLAPLGMGAKDYICVNMKKYNHLSREQRYTIDRLLQ